MTALRRRAAATVVALLLLSACTGDPADSDRPSAPSGTRNNNNGTGDSPSGDLTGAWKRRACNVRPRIARRIVRDYWPGRSPELIAIPREPNYFGGFVGTSHSGPWDYVQEVPIVLYGPGHIRARGELRPDREVTVADIAPTLADLLDTPWPEDRPGRVLTDALVPRSERPGAPKLIVTVVWDGGGTNVLEAWPDAWPNLKRMMREGTWVNGTVGSSPSVTPATHTTIGTGAFPDQHGIVDIDIRRGDDTIDSFAGNSPEWLEIPTLADLYDLAVDNRAVVGMLGFNAWHLGMMSRGSMSDGGDKDVAGLVARDGTGIEGSPKWYEFPEYLNEVGGLEDDVRTVDLEDGRLDSAWLGNDVLDDPFDIKHTPAFIIYETRLAQEMLEREGFGDDDIGDLFFINYKPLDLIGHKYNMLSPEGRSAVAHSDAELGRLTEFLDELVGEGNWVVAFTADHGQTPLAESTGAWPISMDELTADVAERFGVDANELFDRTRPGHFWLDKPTMRAGSISEDAIANFITGYRIEDNVVESRGVPDEYADRLGERVFTAAWPSRATPAVWDCVRRN
jgi:arylsulfatase A-like enzyme